MWRWSFTTTYQTNTSFDQIISSFLGSTSCRVNCFWKEVLPIVVNVISRIIIQSVSHNGHAGIGFLCERFLWCSGFIQIIYYAHVYSVFALSAICGESVACIKKKPRTGSQICYGVKSNAFARPLGFEKKRLNH